MIFFIIVSSLFLMVACGNINSEEFRSIILEKYENDVTVVRDDNEQKLYEEMRLFSGDIVTCKADSYAQLLIDSDKHLYVGEKTELVVKASGTEEDGKVKIDLEYGSGYFVIDNKLPKNSSFEVRTSNATTSVCGTEFSVDYDKDERATTIIVYDGIVSVETNKGKTITLNPGDYAVVFDNELHLYIDNEYSSEYYDDSTNDIDEESLDEVGGEQDNYDDGPTYNSGNDYAYINQYLGDGKYSVEMYLPLKFLKSDIDSAKAGDKVTSYAGVEYELMEIPEEYLKYKKPEYSSLTIAELDGWLKPSGSYYVFYYHEDDWDVFDSVTKIEELTFAEDAVVTLLSADTASNVTVTGKDMIDAGDDFYNIAGHHINWINYGKIFVENGKIIRFTYIWRG